MIRPNKKTTNSNNNQESISMRTSNNHCTNDDSSSDLISNFSYKKQDQNDNENFFKKRKGREIENNRERKFIETDKKLVDLSDNYKKNEKVRNNIEKDQNEGKRTKRLSEFLEKSQENRSIDDYSFKENLDNSVFYVREKERKIRWEKLLMFLIVVCSLLFIFQMLKFVEGGNLAKSLGKIIFDLFAYMYYFISFGILIFIVNNFTVFN